MLGFALFCHNFSWHTRVLGKRKYIIQANLMFGSRFPETFLTFCLYTGRSRSVVRLIYGISHSVVTIWFAGSLPA